MVKTLIYKYKEKPKYLDANRIYTLNDQINEFTNDCQGITQTMKIWGF